MKTTLFVFLSLVLFGISISLASALCITNSDCSGSYYCSKPAGNCSSIGFCAPRPTICIDFHLPVSGCNGMTYENSCVAASYGQNVGRACLSADIDRSGKVDVVDLGIFAANWKMMNCSISNKFCNWTDISHDGKVDVVDLGLLSSSWKVSTGPCS